MGRPRRAARFEARRGAEQGQIRLGATGEPFAGEAPLRRADQRERPVGCDLCEIAVQRLRSGADGAADVIERAAMGAIGGGEHRRAVRPGLLLRRAQFRPMCRESPAVLRLFQHEVEHPQMCAARARIERGLAVKRAENGVDPREGRPCGIGKAMMVMPGEHHVDPVEPRDRKRRPFGRVFGVLRCLVPRWQGRNPGMGEGDHKIGARGSDQLQLSLRGLQERRGRKLGPGPGLEPGEAGGRQHADHRDAQGLLGAVTVEQAAFEHRPGADRRADGGAQIGAEHRKFRRFQRLSERPDPEIELVITKRRSVVAQSVHRRDHRVLAVVAACGLAWLAPELRQRRALKKIAAIEQKAVRGFAARLRDFRGQRCQASARGGAIVEVIVSPSLTMQIGRLKNPQRERDALIRKLAGPIPVRQFSHMIPLARN